MITRLLTIGMALVVGLAWSNVGAFAQTRSTGLQESPQQFGVGQPGVNAISSGLQRPQPGTLGGQQNALGGRQQAGLQTGNRTPQGFVGSDAQDAQSFFQNMDRRQKRRALFDFALESLNEMRESRRRYDARRREPSPVRVQLRPTFLVATSPTPTAGDLVQERLAGALPSSLQSSTEVTLAGRTATIRGVVTSDYDRALAEKMLSLQPGVDQIDNRLTIEQPAETLRLTPEQ